MKEKRALGKATPWKLSAQCVALRGKSKGRNNVEVAQRSSKS